MNLTKIPRHIKCLLFILLFSFFSENRAFAVHTIGGEISYECIPGAPAGTFNIRLVLYRDCIGTPMCTGGCAASCSRAVQIIGADPSCNAQNFGSVTVNLINVRDAQPVPECPTAKSACTNMGCIAAGTFTPAVERYEFIGQVNLNSLGIPASCCNINLVWQECCRNGVISTGAGNQNLYLQATLNRCYSANPCNGSPKLYNDPWVYLCNGVPLMYNIGAIDPDLDSLSYSFVPSLQGHNMSVTYNSPYLYNRPLPWYGPPGGIFPAGIRCDSSNGNIMFTPSGTSIVIGVLAVGITQWKRINGIPIIIGTTRRDIQVAVSQCSANYPPQFTTYPSDPFQAPKTNLSVCAGDQICFDIVARDTNMTDTTNIRLVTNSILGFGATLTKNYNPATRSINGPRHDSLRFCWTPSDSLVSNVPYTFVLEARDNKCPIVGHASQMFSIRVAGKPEAVIKKTNFGCGKWQANYSLPPSNANQVFNQRVYTISSQPNDFNFTQSPLVYTNVQTTPVISFSQKGRYLVRLQLSNSFCTNFFFDTIIVDSMPSPVLSDVFICSGQTSQLQALVTGGITPFTYRWYNSITDTLIPLNSNFTTPAFFVSPIQTRKYILQVRDSLGCRGWDSLIVNVGKLPISILPDTMRLCAGESYTLNPGNDSNRVVSFLWSTGDTTQTINRNDSNNYTVKLTNSIGCIGYDTLKLRVNAPVAANAGNDMTICKNASVTLSGSGGQLYQWKNITGNTIVSAKSANRNITVGPTNTSAPTYYELTTYYGYPNAAPGHKECNNKDTVIVTVNPLPVLTRPSTTKVCRSSDTATLGDFIADIPGGTGVWTYKKPGALLSTNPLNVLVDSLANIPQTDTIRTFDNWIVYTYTTAQNCTTKDSALVTIYGNPPVKAGPILLWCENAGVYAITTSNQKYSPSSPSNSDIQEEWTGNGINHTINGLTRQHFFDPLASGVLKLPLSNIQQYKYTHIYNPSVPSLRLACINSDTVLFRVTPIPTANAGNDITVCKDDGSFAISTRSGATSSMSGSYWAPENVSINAAMSDAATFNPASPAVPNPSSTSTNDVYKLYYINKASGCMVKDSLTLYVKAKPAIGSVSGPVLITNDTLIYTYTLPNQAQHQYIWQVNSGTVSGRSDSSVLNVRWHIPSNTAKGKLKAAITNSLGCTDSAEMEISRLVQPVGMQNLQSLNGFDVYPNPNNGRFVITTEMKSQAMVSFSMTDMLGKQVWNDQQLCQQGLQQMEMNITLPSGIYLLQVSDGSGKVTKKLVVQ